MKNRALHDRILPRQLARKDEAPGGLFNPDTAKEQPVEVETESIRGELTLDQQVVETIAGLAALRTAGISRLGKSRLIAFGDSPKRGVSAEVGKKQVALDIDVVIDYGVDIRQVAAELRRAVSSEVGSMAGREVVEVNVNVVGIQLPEQAEAAVEQLPRVQ